jgi:hypothetical protein
MCILITTTRMLFRHHSVEVLRVGLVTRTGPVYLGPSLSNHDSHSHTLDRSEPNTLAPERSGPSHGTTAGRHTGCRYMLSGGARRDSESIRRSQSPAAATAESRRQLLDGIYARHRSAVCFAT